MAYNENIEKALSLVEGHGSIHFTIKDNCPGDGWDGTACEKGVYMFGDNHFEGELYSWDSNEVNNWIDDIIDAMEDSIVADTKKNYAILLSTNFEEGGNAKLLGIVNVSNAEELKKHLESEFEKLKTSLVDSLGDEETFDDRFSTDVNGMCYIIEENCDDMQALLYEIYAQVIK